MFVYFGYYFVMVFILIFNRMKSLMILVWWVLIVGQGVIVVRVKFYVFIVDLDYVVYEGYYNLIFNINVF